MKRLAGAEITLTPRVRRAVAGDTDLWSHTVGHGFFDQSELTDEEMDVGRAIFSMPGALCYLAVSETGRAGRRGGGGDAEWPGDPVRRQHHRSSSGEADCIGS